MRWLVRNVHVAVEEHTDRERRWLSRFLSYKDRTYRPGRERRDRRISLFNQVTDEFPAGLARAAYRGAQQEGFAVEVVDERVVPCELDADADLEWLRHHPAVAQPITHQIEAVEAAAKRGRGIVWAPTGSGKGEIAIGIVKAIPCRWLFLVHRVDLLRQQVDRYEARTGEPAGLVGDGKMHVPDGCRFVVTSFQTAHRGVVGKPEVRRLVEEWAEGLLVDEAHSLGAETHANTVMRAHSAYYRIGLSATPLARSDDRNLLIVGGLGPVIYRIMPQELIDLGLLANPTIRMAEYQHTRPRGKTWRGVYTQSIVRNRERNKRVVEVVRRADKPALVFVHRVEHGRALVKSLDKAGVNSRFAWGEKSTYQRRELITQLERGYLDALVCNDVFHEGIDIPSLRSVVIASAMKSNIATVQRMGRGMRADAKTHKTAFEVWDIADVGCGCAASDDPVEEHPLWDDPRAPTTHPACRWLEKHTKARKRAYEREGFAVEKADGQLTLSLPGARGVG